MASEPFRIFIAEDDIVFAKIVSHHLTLNPDYEVEIFPDGKSLIKNLYKNPALISLDYNLPDMNGLEALKQIREFNSDTTVIIVSGHQDVATAIELLKKGAYDYILKDQDTKERMWNIAKNIRENVQLKQKIASLEAEIGRKYEVNTLIKGNSQAIHQVFTLIGKAARTNITVSIYGETGTGKELVAKSIHHASSRRKKPFVPVNVTAIPGELIESEMFGHEKGSFTGANNRRIGRFEEANHGTIFLDEIGDMDLNMQSKLLRVLQEEELARVGGNETIKLDVRVIVATHKNLQELVRKGEFREDLYYRLLGLPIHLPPLRERGSDIAILARFFVDEFCQKNKMGKLSISPKAIEKIQKYSFPGNVRELKAIMELSAVMTNTDVIEENDITFSTAGFTKDFLFEENTLEEYNLKIINYFLKKYNNRVRLVADKLKIGKTTIYRLMNSGKL
ncbi:MAG: sigma-54 dependent transcriptional regulator [Lentimicrobium sp.]|nr:sigma-54 dependent transcriptional regulator [Lentimicrobium sp.]